MTASPDNPGLKNWLSIIALGVIWGGAFLSTKVALDGFGPWWVASGRVGMAAIAVSVLGALLGQGMHRISGARSWQFILSFGVISVAGALALLAWGQQHVSSAFAGIAMGAIPLMILPLAYVFSRDEGIGPRRIAGFVVGFIGLVVLVGPKAFSASGADLELWGRLACIGCGCLYAIGSIITRRSPKMPPLAFAAATLWVGTLILVPIAFWAEGAPASLMNTPGYALIYAALIPTAVGAILRVNIIKSAGSVFMSLTSYMVPVWSVIFGMLILGEQISGTMVIGMLLILCGIGLSQSRALLAMFAR
ncbi:MAG: DMT family transporter [Amylibacter sp.]|jgi:drug/metabolite transporter (DMT)-like permease|nr:DMT family transporter [Amylibacter sp.]